MGGFFGAVGKRDVIEDVFFGTDYHSHLGTHRAGMAAYNDRVGLQRDIHNIQNAPFRTKFEHVFEEMEGCAAIGCISDREPQPLIIRGHLGSYAICVIGVINNIEALASQYLDEYGGHFTAMEGSAINATELVAALINRHEDLAAGIRATQQAIDGTASILILKDDGTLVVARDLVGRLPMIVGRSECGYCVTFESFAASKLGYTEDYNIGPAEIVRVTAEGYETLAPAGDTLHICSFLWMYYGYPNSTYEGVNVEAFRYRNGEIMARDERERGVLPDVDYVAGMPDSGIPHAIGYANASHKPFGRPFVKYTPT
jgi:amidophosphoribosyltransferase